MTIAQEPEPILKGANQKSARDSGYETALVLIVIAQVFEIIFLFNSDQVLRMVFPDLAYWERGLWWFLFLGLVYLTALAGFIISWILFSEEKDPLVKWSILLAGILVSVVAIVILGLNSASSEMLAFFFMYWFEIGMSFGIVFVLAMRKVQGLSKGKT